MAPLIVKNMVIVGSSGAPNGVRGHIDAFDISTGQRLWRRYRCPSPANRDRKPGPPTARGSAAAARPGSPEATIPNSTCFTGAASNPSPDFDGSMRPGDNLYTDLVLAMDPDDGTIRWHYQFTPHDVWDYSGSTRTSCSNPAGGGCSRISTATDICSSSTEPTASGSASPSSATA